MYTTGTVGAVLEEHGDLRGGVPIRPELVERRLRKRRTQGEHAERVRTVARAQRQRERQTGALREAAHDRLAARHAVLGGGLVEQVIELAERRLERGGDLGRREAEVVPGEPGHPGHGDGPARKHGDEPPVRIEVREEPAEVALVGAEPVDEEQQAVGVAPAHDIRDQRHGPSGVARLGSVRSQHPRGRR